MCSCHGRVAEPRGPVSLSFPCGRCGSSDVFRLGSGGRSRPALCLALCPVNPLHILSQQLHLRGSCCFPEEETEA